MKRTFILSLLLVCSLTLSATGKKTSTVKQAPAFTLPSTETVAERDARMQWWRESRFGMFIHFGLYAMPARHEWVKNKECMTDERYANYFKYFNPDLFQPKEWARMAKEAGMKYVVLTSKHHEGFCLWDSKYTDYKVTNTPYGRDLLREFVDAFRAEGIRIGFYYSLIDWHHPDFTIDSRHPQRLDKNASPEEYAKLNVGKNMDVYRQYMKDQVTELLTNYGKIDIIWFDFSYPKVNGKGRNDWDSKGLLTLAKTLQPGILVDSRLDLDDVPGGWDFLTPEQFKVKSCPTVNGIKVPWETCQTFSGSWGYYRDEQTWKSPAQLIELLSETVSKGGNLILNVGPTARGEFDHRAVDRLSAIAKWMHWNSRSIYGCTEAPEEFKAPDNTILTYNPEKKIIYVHLLDYPMGRLNVEFADKIEYAQLLHDGSEVIIKDKVVATHSGDPRRYTYFSLPVIKPDVEIPVIECYLK